MHCDEFEIRWNDRLDLRSKPEDDPSMLAHARDCEKCRALLSAGELLFASLPPAPPAPPGDVLAAGVLAAMQIERPRPASRPPFRAAPARRSRALVWLALAAAVSLACWPLLRSGFDPDEASQAPDLPPSGPAVAVADSSTDVSAPAPDPLAHLARDATDAYLGLARETGDRVSRALSVVPAGELSLRVDSIGLTNVGFFYASAPAEAQGPAAERTVTWLDGVATSLRPLTRSTTGALNSLGRALPEPRVEKGS